MVDFPVALAEVARVEPTRGGVIAVVDLDAEGVPSAGRSIITVDVQSGAIVGTAGVQRRIAGAHHRTRRANAVPTRSPRCRQGLRGAGAVHRYRR